jgi:uncharacterized OsmC-like protein
MSPRRRSATIASTECGSKGRNVVTTQTIRNGVSVSQLVDTIELIKRQPDLARFQFRARSAWEGGGRTRTTIQGFFGAGQEDTSRSEPFTVIGDEPPVLLGGNAGPNAVEAVLQALASCLGVGFVYNASALGIDVRALEFELEGNLDLHGFLGLSETTRPGFSGIRVSYRVDADAPRDKIEELCSYVQKTSPVLDMLRNSVPVSVEIID